MSMFPCRFGKSLGKPYLIWLTLCVTATIRWCSNIITAHNMIAAFGAVQAVPCFTISPGQDTMQPIHVSPAHLPPNTARALNIASGGAQVRLHAMSMNGSYCIFPVYPCTPVHMCACTTGAAGWLTLCVTIAFCAKLGSQ